MSYQQEEQITALKAEIVKLQAKIDDDGKPKGPFKTRYIIQGDDVAWKSFQVSEPTEGWSVKPYDLMKELKKPDDYVAVPFEDE